MTTVRYIPAISTDAGAIPVETQIATHARAEDSATVQDVYIDGGSVKIFDESGDIAEVVTGANTGVKGLRVYGGPTDPISDIPVYIDYDHHQNHEGEAHQYTYPLTALALNNTVYFRLVVPVYNPVIYSPHMKIEVETLAQTTVSLYETPTTTANGTLQTTYNRNRNQSAIAAGMTIYLAPTVTATGTLLSAHTVGDATAGTSSELHFDEWILSSNKVYLIGIKANAASDSVCMRVKFYEDLGV